MSYLKRLKAEVFENPLPSIPTKPTKAPSGSFVSGQSRLVSEMGVSRDASASLPIPAGLANLVRTVRDAYACPPEEIEQALALAANDPKGRSTVFGNWRGKMAGESGRDGSPCATVKLIRAAMLLGFLI